ncbi:hypothetical protein HC864_03045 [Candidatus Gracilibacteria bacterium]|nr:hypothetical protein [Candidatus Gracilibacteria bacterium]
MTSKFVRFLVFGIIGIWNTLFDLGLFWSGMTILSKIGIKKTQKLAPIANIFSFLTSNIVSYYLNSSFTWRDSSNSKGFLPYLIVTLISLAVSTILISFFTKPKYFDIFQKSYKTFSFSQETSY